MGPAATPYDAPIINLTVTDGEAGTLRWKLEIRSVDAKGARSLGYLATGDDLAAAAAGSAFPLRVHDELRDVWTEMPSNHRTDVRQSMRKLLEDAIVSLASVGAA
jgi:hypothetical protein